MTPFRIRQRLKAMLGLSEPTTPRAPERARFDVSFVCPDGSEYTTSAREGDSLVLAAGRGPQPISTGCTDSSCGTCRVDVLAGAESLTAADAHEHQTKASVGVPESQRLGCQTGVVGPGVRVRITNVLGEELIDP